jgi:8-oxo-dGTP pyrophosphatase MutT (NUDIX family)
VRVVVVDAEGHVLLIRARDVTAPELGEWWELPGGGLEPGESVVAAARRELWEEVGLDVPRSDIPAPSWHRIVAYPFHGVLRVQVESVVAVAVDGVRPLCAPAEPDDYERDDHAGSRWVDVGWVEGAQDLFFPGTLPRYLRAHLEGEVIVEPFEWWPPDQPGKV